MPTTPLQIHPRIPEAIVRFLGNNRLISSPTLTRAMVDEARTVLAQPTYVVNTLVARAGRPLNEPKLLTQYAVEALNEGIFTENRIPMPGVLREQSDFITVQSADSMSLQTYFKCLSAMLDPATAAETLAEVAAARSGAAMVRQLSEDDDFTVLVGKGKRAVPAEPVEGVTQGTKHARRAKSTGPIGMPPKAIEMAGRNVDEVLVRLLRRKEVDEKSATALKNIVDMIISGQVEGMTTTDRQRVVNKLKADTINAQHYIVSLYTENAYGGTLFSEKWVIIPNNEAAEVGLSLRQMEKPIPEIGMRIGAKASVTAASEAYNSAMSACDRLADAKSALTGRQWGIISAANPGLFGNSEGDGVARGGIGRLEERGAALRDLYTDLEHPAALIRSLRIYGEAGVFPLWQRSTNHPRVEAGVLRSIWQLVNRAEAAMVLGTGKQAAVTAEKEAGAFFDRLITSQPAGAKAVKDALERAKASLGRRPGLLTFFVKQQGEKLVAAIEENPENQPTNATAIARFITYAEALERDAKLMTEALRRLRKVADESGDGALAALSSSLPGIGEIERTFALGAPVPEDEGIYGLLERRGLPAPESMGRLQLPKPD